MSKSFLSHVFEPFAQEDSSARTSYMGTGLGMPIAKQLTEMMGGKIAVESELNVVQPSQLQFHLNSIQIIKKKTRWKRKIYRKIFRD